MLHDRSIRVIHDFPESIDCFPGVEIQGGVCFFLWNRDNKGDSKEVRNEDFYLSNNINQKKNMNTNIKNGNKNKISKTIPKISRILFFTLSPAIILHFLLSALAKLNLND